MEELKDFLKSLAKVAIACAVIAAIVVLIVKLQPPEEIQPDLEVRGYDGEEEQIILENDELKLVMDAATTRFEVQVKDTGAVWYSNPTDADDDRKALSSDIDNLKSTLILTYGTINGVWTAYNNSSLSIDKGLYEIDADDECIKVHYTIGNVKKEYCIPIAVPESRYEEIMEPLSSKEKKQVKEYYRKYDIKKLRKTDDKDELLAKYPDLENEPVYVLIDTIADYLKKKIETIVTSYGYSQEDYEADLARYENVSTQEIPLFNVTMEYRLDGGDLLVSVPYDQIEYREKYPITKIRILPYFGAGGLEDEGFIVVPESGGAVIGFNNGKYDQNAYTSDIYGWDYAISREAVVTETRNTFPVFAIANNGNSFVCYNDEGASYASVTADVSGRLNSYNFANMNYSVLHYEEFDVSGKSNSSFYVFEDKLPDTVVTQRYSFLAGADYIDMAYDYRSYLQNRYPGLGKNSSGDAKTVVEIVEAIDKVQQKFGVPVSSPLSLTTYDETAQIAKTLKEDCGADKLAVKVSGWMNGGITHSILNKIKLIRELGGRKSFDNMLDAMSKEGIDVYLDGQTEFAYDSDVTDGFIAFRDAARFASREECELYDYSIIWYGETLDYDSHYLLKPQVAEENYDVLESFADKKNTGISLRDTGYYLSADYNPKNLNTREDVIRRQREKLADTIQNSSAGIMINRGNEYAIEYADIVTSMDISNSNMAIIDYDIPFYQIALHGLVSYNCAPVNLAEDYELEILRAAEYGAGLSFLFTASEADKLQDTYYTKYYGAAFSLWKDRAAKIISRYNREMGSTEGALICGHRLAGDRVRVTEYDNGTRVYVNYGFLDETVDGITVPARDYTVKGGEAR